MMTTLSRGERDLARKRAQSRLAAQQPNHYRELLQQAREITSYRSTARSRAITQLAQANAETFRVLFEEEIAAAKKRKATTEAARGARVPVKVRETKTFFMHDPARNCADADPDIFFPPRGGSAQRQAAIRICRHCPLAGDCFRWADKRDIKHGIWGGVDMSKDAEKKAARTLVGSA